MSHGTKTNPNALWERLAQCHAVGCAIQFWCPTYEARRTTKVCENCCWKYGECELCDTVQEVEEAAEQLCQRNNALRCTVCGTLIGDGQTYYEHEDSDERNCSEDCLNVALDSLYGVKRWQRHDIGNGTGDVRYTALIRNEWRPLPINLTATQEA